MSPRKTGNRRTAINPLTRPEVQKALLAGKPVPERWRHRVSDLSPLAGLSGLQVLDLRGTGVTDVSALSGLSELKELYLSGTGVTDVSALSRLDGLHWLDLSDTGVTDVSVLSGLTGLQALVLSGTGVSDVSTLSGLTKLQRLDLSGTGVTDVSALSGLTDLHWIFLRGTGVTDVSVLSGLTGLQWLDLRDASVTDVSALAHLTYLNVFGLEDDASLHIPPWLDAPPPPTVAAVSERRGAPGGRQPMPALSGRVTLAFDDERWLQKALRAETPGLSARVVSRRRGFFAVQRPAAMPVDQFQAMLHRMSSDFGAQLADDRQHTLEAIPTFDARMRDGAGGAQADLDDVLHAIGADAVHNRTRGGDVTIAVVDTGINGQRAEFPAFRRAGGWAEGGLDPWEDDNGHGTMCACIAAATRAAGGRFQGVAPEARLMACRSDLYDSQLMDIYDELADRAEQGEVIVASNSYGDPTPVPQHPKFKSALDRAVAAGVHFVFSAGNYHADVGGADDGCGPNSIWLHKGRADVLTAGTCDLDGDMWFYSSRGPGQFFDEPGTGRKPDVMAPTPRNGLVLFGGEERVMEIGWGTSGAAPQVAGLLALLLSLRRDLPRDELFDMIRTTATSLGHAHECQGFGRIDCLAAVDRLFVHA